MSNVYATASSKLINVDLLNSDDICLDDIAHHLSKIQRFNGATPLDISYTVGEHCINLARYWIDKTPASISIKLARFALLHDASEAYISDIVSPFKKKLNDYKDLEGIIQGMIDSKFGGYSSSSILCMSDKRILIDEVETIMPEKLQLYQSTSGLEKLGCNIMYNNHPSTVKTCYLNLCKVLGVTDE